MRSLWRASQPINQGDIAGRYLSLRCAITAYPASLRFVPNLFHRETRTAYPGMLAVFASPDGRPSHLHKTYLNPEGGKAPVSEPRMFARGKIEQGGAVRLAAPSRILGIAEGIETALSAQAVTGVPCWAALNTSLLVKWQPPEIARHVVIFGDNDSHFGGQRAAFDLAKGLQAGGQQVTVCIPVTFKDWNDVHSNLRRGCFRGRSEVARARETINPNLEVLPAPGEDPNK
jgi:putative DNA primase/helicase